MPKRASRVSSRRRGSCSNAAPGCAPPPHTASCTRATTGCHSAPCDPATLIFTEQCENWDDDRARHKASFTALTTIDRSPQDLRTIHNNLNTFAPRISTTMRCFPRHLQEDAQQRAIWEEAHVHLSASQAAFTRGGLARGVGSGGGGGGARGRDRQQRAEAYPTMLHHASQLARPYRCGN